MKSKVAPTKNQFILIRYNLYAFWLTKIVMKVIIGCLVPAIPDLFYRTHILLPDRCYILHEQTIGISSDESVCQDLPSFDKRYSDTQFVSLTVNDHEITLQGPC